MTAGARRLGAADPRTEQQRRSDLLVDALLGQLRLTDPDDEPDLDVSDADLDPDGEDPDLEPDVADHDPGGEGDPGESGSGGGGWLEVEHVDRDTRRTPWGDSAAADEPGEAIPTGGTGAGEVSRGEANSGGNRRGQGFRRHRWDGLGCGCRHRWNGCGWGRRVGPVGAPADDSDRGGGGVVDPARRRCFTRLLTDDGGRLLDTTELVRYASRRLAQSVKVRTGSCCYPTCTVSAARCDLDHHSPSDHQIAGQRSQRHEMTRVGTGSIQAGGSTAALRFACATTMDGGAIPRALLGHAYLLALAYTSGTPGAVHYRVHSRRRVLVSVAADVYRYVTPLSMEE